MADGAVAPELRVAAAPCHGRQPRDQRRSQEREMPHRGICARRWRQRRPLAKRVVEFAKTPSEQGALMLAAFGFRPWQPHSM
jgi:hypothetical protein